MSVTVKVVWDGTPEAEYALYDYVDAIEKGKETKPVWEQSFWRDRIYRTVAADGRLHQVIYDNSYEVWQYIQQETAGLLRRAIPRGSSLLDAGCGYGALVDSLRLVDLDVTYTGIDFAPDLIELANRRYRDRRFVVGSIYQLPFGDKKFDYIVCRSVQGMTIRNSGVNKWRQMVAELRRVCRYRLILMDYPETLEQPVNCVVIRFAKEPPGFPTVKGLETDQGSTDPSEGQ